MIGLACIVAVLVGLVVAGTTKNGTKAVQAGFVTLLAMIVFSVVLFR